MGNSGSGDRGFGDCAWVLGPGDSRTGVGVRAAYWVWGLGGLGVGTGIGGWGLEPETLNWGLGTRTKGCRLGVGLGTESWELVLGSQGTGSGEGTRQPLRFRGAERGVGRGSAAGRKGLDPAGGRKSWQSYSSG